MKFKSILLTIVIAVAILFAFSGISQANYVISPFKTVWPMFYDDANGTFLLLYDTARFYVRDHKFYIMDGNYPSINDYVARADGNYPQDSDANHAHWNTAYSWGDYRADPNLADDRDANIIRHGSKTVNPDDINDLPYISFESGSKLYLDTVTISVADVNKLYSTPKTLVSAPGTHNYIELLSLTLIYDYNSTAWQRVTANMTAKYTNGSGAVASGTLAGNGFLDQAGDKIAKLLPVAVASTTATSIENQPLVLVMDTADPCGPGDTTATSSMRAKVSYRIHPSGL